MAALDDIEGTLQWLTRAEKVRLLEWLVHDLADTFPGVEVTPGVSGGEPRIARTRIPVWLLEQARRLGTSEADLLCAYPMLSAEDLVNAWSFVRAHQDEIDRQIRDNEAA